MTDPKSSEDHSTLATCFAGHPIPTGAHFCPTCGQPADGSKPPTEVNIAGAYQISAKRRRRTWLLVALPLVVVISLVAIATAVFVLMSDGKAPAPVLRANEVTVTVNMVVSGVQSDYIDSGDCDTGLTGLNDIEDGTQVRVLGDQRQILGVSQLQAGIGSADVAVCSYSAKITGVPDDQEYYTMEIGSGRRGDITSSKQDLLANSWTFDLSIG